MLQAGARISEGQLPYRDFYANYGPGQYFLVGGLDVLFGPSLLTWRVLRVALDAAVAVWPTPSPDATRPSHSRSAAWIAVAAAMAFPSIPHPNPTALALGFAALLLAQRSPLGAGALAGIAVAFRLDVGLAALAGAASTVWSVGGRRAAVRVALAGVLTAVALHAPFLIAAAGDFWEQTLGFALHEQRSAAPPAPRSLGGRLRAEQDPAALLRPTCCSPARRSGSLVALSGRAPLRLWAPAPLAAAGVVYFLARADVYPSGAAGGRAAGPPRYRRRPRARERRARWTALPLIAVLILVALHGVDRKRIQAVRPAAARADQRRRGRRHPGARPARPAP